MSDYPHSFRSRNQSQGDAAACKRLPPKETLIIYVVVRLIIHNFGCLLNALPFPAAASFTYPTVLSALLKPCELHSHRLVLDTEKPRLKRSTQLGRRLSSTDCLYRNLGFIQHPHGSSQRCVTPVLGYLLPFFMGTAHMWYEYIYIHAGWQNTLSELGFL